MGLVHAGRLMNSHPKLLFHLCMHGKLHLVEFASAHRPAFIVVQGAMRTTLSCPAPSNAAKILQHPSWRLFCTRSCKLKRKGCEKRIALDANTLLSRTHFSFVNCAIFNTNTALLVRTFRLRQV